MILVGIDEAGYGPTLGPLVVSAAVFQIGDGRKDEFPDSDEYGIDLWKLLPESVTRKPDKRRIPINDSKKIHRWGKGLGALEEGVLPFLHISKHGLPGDLRALLRYLGRNNLADRYLDCYPWYRDRNLKLPTDTYGNYVKVLGDRLEEELQNKEVKFLGLTALPIEVLQFNQVLTESDNKALIPFDAIASLLRQIWNNFPDDHIEVIVDRQGGRTQYAQLLYKNLQLRGIRIECQTVERSTYVLLRKKSEIHVTFTRQGDSKSFGVALASMTSKYLRELHMKIFNQFWSEQQSTLKPTAGYPTDARRFLGEISQLRNCLDIDDNILIRRR